MTSRLGMPCYRLRGRPLVWFQIAGSGAFCIQPRSFSANRTGREEYRRHNSKKEPGPEQVRLVDARQAVEQTQASNFASFIAGLVNTSQACNCPPLVWPGHRIRGLLHPHIRAVHFLPHSWNLWVLQAIFASLIGSCRAAR